MHVASLVPRPGNKASMWSYSGSALQGHLRVLQDPPGSVVLVGCGDVVSNIALGSLLWLRHF